MPCTNPRVSACRCQETAACLAHAKLCTGQLLPTRFTEAATSNEVSVMLGQWNSRTAWEWYTQATRTLTVQLGVRLVWDAQPLVPGLVQPQHCQVSILCVRLQPALCKDNYCQGCLIDGECKTSEAHMVICARNSLQRGMACRCMRICCPQIELRS